jgi:hypothetical protein
MKETVSGGKYEGLHILVIVLLNNNSLAQIPRHPGFVENRWG